MSTRVVYHDTAVECGRLDSMACYPTVVLLLSLLSTSRGPLPKLSRVIFYRAGRIHQMRYYRYIRRYISALQYVWPRTGTFRYGTVPVLVRAAAEAHRALFDRCCWRELASDQHFCPKSASDELSASALT